MDAGGPRDLLQEALLVLHQTYQTGAAPTLPPHLAGNELLASLLHQTEDYHQFALRLAAGDLSPVLGHRGAVAGSLKTLQSGLRHLTWQTQQIAQGDFSQRVDFMGDFSCAFNGMVTALQDARGRLEEARIRAEEGAQAKSLFLASMSHEIRTLMNAILGFADLALELEAPAELRDCLEKIHSAGRNLLGLINDILDLSRIEAGKLSMESIPFQLQDVLEDVGDLLALRAEEKGVELLLGIAPRLPGPLVGDPLRLSQILLNLAGNAIKFTDAGHVSVRAELLEARDGQVRIRFLVQDTGIGLTEEQRGRIFQPFNQGDDSTTRKYGGTGLGLAISRHLAERMGGTIGVESQLGAGSLFWFTAVFPWGAPGDGLEISAPPELAKVPVLVADANPVAREMLLESLAFLGFRAMVVASVEEALQELKRVSRSEPYGVLLLDRGMAGLERPELIRTLQEASGSDLMPILVMVPAPGREESRKLALQIGAQGIVPKLASPFLLVAALRRSLGHERVEAMESWERGIPEADVGQLGGLRVLLAEDHAINQQLILDLLRRGGVEADLASDGLQAVRMAQEKPYDAVLMDVQMPGLDGYQAARRIREQPGHGALPIIALTAHALSGCREACLKAGMDDYLSKPITTAELYRVLVRCCRKGPIRSEGALASELPGVESLQALEGMVDVPKALVRTQGSVDLLKSLLRAYADTEPFPSRQIQEALEAGKPDEAFRVAHSLKSVAGILEVPALLEAAREVEHRLGAGLLEGFPILLDQLAHLDMRLRQLLVAFFRSGAGQDLSAPAPWKSEELRIRLVALLGEVRTGSAGARKGYEALWARPFPEGIRPMLEEVGSCLSRRAFSEALDLLATVLEKL